MISAEVRDQGTLVGSISFQLQLSGDPSSVTVSPRVAERETQDKKINEYKKMMKSFLDAALELILQHHDLKVEQQYRNANEIVEKQVSLVYTKNRWAVLRVYDRFESQMLTFILFVFSSAYKLLFGTTYPRGT